MIDAGYVAPGYVATTLIAAGRFEEDADNTGGAAGAISAPVKSGIFRFDNSSAGDLIVQADVGKDCFIVDDQTVAKTNGTNTRSVAGKIHEVNADGVFVKVGY